MRFHFSLEGLLRVRESFEKQIEQQLAVAVAELQRVKAMIEAVREQLMSTETELGRLLARGSTGAYVHLLCYERHLLERRELALAESLTAASAAVQEQQHRLRVAQQKRKILETLREKQLALYLLTAGRREQQNLDDTFLLRRYGHEGGKDVA